MVARGQEDVDAARDAARRSVDGLLQRIMHRAGVQEEAEASVGGGGKHGAAEGPAGQDSQGPAAAEVEPLVAAAVTSISPVAAARGIPTPHQLRERCVTLSSWISAVPGVNAAGGVQRGTLLSTLGRGRCMSKGDSVQAFS